MASFPGVRVEIATATADTIEIHGDMALDWGSYFEKLAFPGQPVSEQRGKFVAEWVRQDRPSRHYRREPGMIRKLKSGECRLYSIQKNPKTGRR